MIYAFYIFLLSQLAGYAVRWEDDDEEGAPKKSKKAEKPAGNNYGLEKDCMLIYSSCLTGKWQLR